jgi:hypothetical protein
MIQLAWIYSMNEFTSAGERPYRNFGLVNMKFSSFACHAASLAYISVKDRIADG